jgi:hypothetical protein
MIGILTASIRRILTEKKKQPDKPFESPAKRYKADRSRINVDSFDRDAIRREIYGIYNKKEHVMLTKLLVSINQS